MPIFVKKRDSKLSMSITSTDYILLHKKRI